MTLREDLESARDWLLPGRDVTKVEVDACLTELDKIINNIEDKETKSSISLSKERAESIKGRLHAADDVIDGIISIFQFPEEKKFIEKAESIKHSVAMFFQYIDDNIIEEN